MNRYDDIIDYPYEMRHTRMSIENRCAQFAPFSALSGFSDLIEEENREVLKRRELTEEEKLFLNQKLLILKRNIFNKPIVTITYFLPDSFKDGGKYEKMSGIITKTNLNYLIFENKTKIKISDIIDITSEDIKLNFE